LLRSENGCSAFFNEFQREHVSIITTIGKSDISVQVVANNSDEVYRFATDIIGKIPGVRRTTTSIVPIVLKDVYDWKIPASIGRNTSD